MAYYYITDECVRCDGCKNTCPVGAPTFNGERYNINQDLCVGCGACAAYCPVGAIYPDDYIVPPAPEKIPGVRDAETDVLIIGAGPAGLAAAANLSEQGYRVTILDAAKKPGGAGVFSTFYKVFDSKWELDACETRYLDDYVRAAMTATKYQLRASLLRSAFQANTEFFDWFCTYGEPEKILRLADAPKGKAVSMIRPTGRYFVEKLLEHAVQNGTTLQSSTRAKQLIMEAGKVTGVLAEDAQGDIAYHARCTLIATGNMCQAPDLADYLPDYATAEPLRNPHRSPYATGDGVRMIKEAGIAIDNENVIPHYLGAMPATFDNIVLKQGLRPEGLRVNKLGQRFISEGCDRFDAVDVLLKQPGCVSYNIVDSNILMQDIQPTLKLEAKNALMIDDALPVPGKRMQYVDFMGLPVQIDENGKVIRFNMGGMSDGAGEAPPEPKPDPTKLKEYAETLGGHVCVADTLEELAAQIGAEPETLKATVARYNELCQQGCDTDYAKYSTYMIPIAVGPFYAFKCFLCSDGAFGGVFIDDGCRVTNGSAVIPGLYAAGDLTSGNYIKENSHRTEVINDFTWACASGYLSTKSMINDMK